MTKVLCIGYYDKFTRFFLHLKKRIKQENQAASVVVESTYFSGFLYGLIRLQSSGWLSMRAWFRAVRKKKQYQKQLSLDKVYKGFVIDELTRYSHQKDPRMIWQTMAYIDLIENKITGVTQVVMIGDSRLPFEITKQWAKRKNIPIYFLEQGPYSTTFIDQKGVNANASIRGYKPDSVCNLKKKERVADFLQRKKNKKYLRSPLYRGLDYLYEMVCMKTAFFPPDLKIDNPVFKNLSKRVTHKALYPEEHKGKTIYLLICQVPFDVNMTHHSPHYSSHADILKNVHDNLPENSLLVVREHPVYRGKYESAFYDLINRHGNIWVDFGKDFEQVLSLANAVIVNNSTMGLEAISKNKSVLALGNSYYDSSEICLKMHHKNELKNQLIDVLSFRPDENRIIDFMFQFIEKQVVDGFVTDQKLIAADAIYQQIFNNKSV